MITRLLQEYTKNCLEKCNQLRGFGTKCNENNTILRTFRGFILVSLKKKPYKILNMIRLLCQAKNNLTRQPFKSKKIDRICFM